MWTLEREAPLRFKVRISKHDHCHCLSVAAMNWVCGVWYVVCARQPSCCAQVAKKISKTIKSPDWQPLQNLGFSCGVEEKRYHSELAAFLKISIQGRKGKRERKPEVETH